MQSEKKNTSQIPFFTAKLAEIKNQLLPPPAKVMGKQVPSCTAQRAYIKGPCFGHLVTSIQVYGVIPSIQQFLL